MRIFYSGIGIVVAVAFGAALAWWLLWGKPELGTPSTAATSSSEISLASSPELPSTLGPHRDAPVGEWEYYNEQYRFSLFYPEGLTTHIYDEGGGASTFVFENTAHAQGFQIFVVPYGAPQVSAERFARDEPSGVMRAPRDVTIDGVSAKSFFGSSAELGDTAEVWFVRGGYLFEVTAPASLAQWLSQILLTWKFL